MRSWDDQSTTTTAAATRPRIALGVLGGTATMTGEPGKLRPRSSAEALVAAVPHLGPVADIEATTLAVLPGASLGASEVRRVLTWARRAVADSGVRGVVLVQGTDTLEETAYLLDLHWDQAAPLVVTGAMRGPERAGADGPANLLAAVVTAAATASIGLGVLVVTNDEVHAAARVVKGDSLNPAAFRSPGFGPLARIVEDQPHYANRSRRSAPLPPTAATTEPARVAIATSHLDDDGELLGLIGGANYDGVVLAALGVGHVSAGAADVVADLAGHMPVVLASRVGSGPVTTATYGFPGSETDLIDRGAVPAGWLTPAKARVLLQALLDTGATSAQIRREIIDRGRAPWRTL